MTAAATALTLAACTPDTPPPQVQEQTSSAAAVEPGTEPKVDTTFTFATAADPAGLDPAIEVDNASYRVTRQILETLVTVDPVTGEPVPQLATDWSRSDGGRSYTFELRDGVTFHDGAEFDAEAVCFNFERWFTLPGSVRDERSSLQFQTVFKAFANAPDLSAYQDCVVQGEHKFTLELNERYTGLLPALTMPAFGISSPAALKAGHADVLNHQRDGHRLSAYGLHPVGTGPYTFESWSGDDVVLKSYKDYWGDRGQIRKIIFTTMSDAALRQEALKDGRIDGYDLVTADTFEPLAKAGMKVLLRDPFSVLYMGINQDFGALDDPKVRQALAHAIDKQQLVDTLFIDGTEPAGSFLPQLFDITAPQAAQYEHDPEKARKLLEESSYDGGEIPFYYPLDVSRAYLPRPERVYALLSRQLTAAGFNLKPVPIEWSDGYLQKVQSNSPHGLHLLGWSGSYQDPDNFVGPLFGSESEEFGFTNEHLFSMIDRARTLPAGEQRTKVYQNIETEISAQVPAVPLAFPISALALSPRVESYPVSPVLDEVFNEIVLTE
ncbi:ABC transporter substrate-binding protein [Arthrobacter castelli]|uniref:ABC transporter substrate-binding protein n=1 Tax=Arthrobacter castelli TaxID=271431 RepID=UPI001FE15C0E|nr:ABC transporter substrate-binding protein [Arthrobacter castelli]